MIDNSTLSFILNLNAKEEGVEDFQKVVKFIKDNKTDILAHMEHQNLFYARLNLALALPMFVVFASAIPLLAATACPPILALGVCLLAGFLVLATIVACSRLDYDNIAKKNLYEELAREPTLYAVNQNGFFNNELFITCETASNLSNLPKIIGITP